MTDEEKEEMYNKFPSGKARKLIKLMEQERIGEHRDVIFGDYADEVV